MAKIIIPGEKEEFLQEAVDAFRKARYPGAITGAGISVESGIPDFRSPGGLWTIFDPQEYATIDTFLRNPEKSWVFFRELGKTLKGPKPNAAHTALARLEGSGSLRFVITQNIDGLHNDAGSSEVIAVHGDNRNLHCLSCDTILPVEERHFSDEAVPSCPGCGGPLKPRVVLFGESIIDLDRSLEHLDRCDLLLVIGTSAQVYPVADFPRMVSLRGGLVYEFNLEATPLTGGSVFPGLPSRNGASDYLFMGSAGDTLKRFADLVLEKRVQ